jgi:hypothetical protein
VIKQYDKQYDGRIIGESLSKRSEGSETKKKDPKDQSPKKLGGMVALATRDRQSKHQRFNITINQPLQYARDAPKIKMHKPLLTSSQVSVLISTIVIGFCTFALFFAGYALQQQTLQNLHKTLRPSSPLPRHLQEELLSNNGQYKFPGVSKLTGSLHKITQRILFEETESQFDWSRFAQAQLVRNHDNVCDALITFHELHMQKSSAPKLLLFPRTWLDATEGDEAAQLSLRLIRKASRLYRAILVPIGPLKKGANGRFTLS